MPDLMEIFQSQPDKYDVLVSREDYEGNLLPALIRITPLEGRKIVEFGAGTGRVTRLLAPTAASILAFDSSESMLGVAARTLRASGQRNWQVAVADHRKVPAPTGAADVVLSGWSICCLAVYSGASWERELDAGLREMKRVVAPGGMVIIIETLGTGYSSPHSPEGLTAYYGNLTGRGFQSSWIRTDYRFQSMAEAKDLTTFFFGSEPLATLRVVDGGVVLPECTGLWWIPADRLS